MTDSLLTRGQLERKLSQEIQSFYRHHLEHRPSKVICQIFADKLAITLEDSIANTEQILLNQGHSELARQVRSNLENATEAALVELIEQIVGVQIVDLLSDTALETKRMGIIALLSDTPKVRNPETIPKAKTTEKQSI